MKLLLQDGPTHFLNVSLFFFDTKNSSLFFVFKQIFGSTNSTAVIPNLTLVSYLKKEDGWLADEVHWNVHRKQKQI